MMACFAATPSHAAWHVAKSKHFIIYSDENPKVLREFDTQLERFDLLGLDVALVVLGQKLIRHIRQVRHLGHGHGLGPAFLDHRKENRKIRALRV